MRFNAKRVWSGVAAVAVATTTALILGPGTAFAAGTVQGAATVKNAAGAANLASGNSATTFTLRLPSGASCGGDTANAGYTVTSYMVPAAIDPSTLTFDGNGPLPFGTGASFRQPLYTTTGSPYTDAATSPAVPPSVLGAIINIPDMNYSVFAPGDIPPGVYNIGIACVQGPASGTQMKEYWNVQKTFTTNTTTGGPAQVNWAQGTIPAAPVLNTVTSGNASLTANFTPGAANPAATLYTATATPGPFSATSTTGSPITITGLANGTAYSVTVKATNTVGDSAASNAVSGTPAVPANPPVTNLTATPGIGKVDLSWTAPTGTPPTSYTVGVSPVAGSTTITGTTASVTGLTAGTLYTFTVTPVHTPAGTETPASVGPVTPLSATAVVQDVTVTRPAGAIVLTQVCGRYGALAADTLATPGFPSGSLPALAAVAGGTAPTLTAGGTDSDPKFSEYPYPENANGTPAPNYPTHCGIDLGIAKFVKTGPGAGQFYAASGRLNQVTVVDNRDTDIGWTATGTMSTFSAGPGKTFSGSQLGWTPVKTSDTASFTDSDGISYDQVVTAGGIVAANTANATGLSTGRTLGSAAGLSGTSPTLTGGLGISELDARLKLLIPVTKVSGVYTGTLTMTVS